MTSVEQETSSISPGAEDRVREAVEKWLRDDRADPLDLQAELTVWFLEGDSSSLGFETWRLVCEAVDTGWSRQSLERNLALALAQHAVIPEAASV